MRPKIESEDYGEIENRVHEVASVTNRKPIAASQSRSKFLTQANAIHQSRVSKSLTKRPNYWRLPILKEFKMGTITTVLLILGLLLGGTTATAYASQDAMPDGVLYPVKLVTEGLQSDLSGSPEAKLEFALQFAETRVEEITQLQEEGLMPPESVFLNLQMQIQQAIQLATQLGEDNLEPALLQIRERLQIQLQMLGDGNLEPVMLRTRDTLRERIQLVDTGIGNLSGFYNEAQNGWENTPLMNQGKEQQLQIQEQNSGYDQVTPEPGSNSTPGQQDGSGPNTNDGTPNFGTPAGPGKNDGGRGN
jgi:hypothetical protein